MKILILNNLYRPFSKGGAERVIETIADGLKAQGNEILVVTTLPKDRKQNAASDVAYLSGLPSLFYDLAKLPKPLRLIYHLSGYLDVSTYRQTKKIINGFSPDLIITNNLVGLGLSSMRAIRTSKAKHVHILHDIQLLHPSGLLMWRGEGLIDSASARCYQKLNRSIFSNASLVISPSQWLLDLHLKRGFFKDCPSEVISNPAGFSPSAVAPRLAPTVDCLYVGQLEPHKGINLLLEAMSLLPDNYRLKVAGSGSLESLVAGASEKDHRITFLGRLTPQQVAAEMKRSSVLVVPSLCYENSPTVIYEAMAKQLPIIAADIGGIPELITDRQNLFKPGDARSLASTLTGPYERNQKLPDDKVMSIKRYVEVLSDKIKAL